MRFWFTFLFLAVQHTAFSQSLINQVVATGGIHQDVGGISLSSTCGEFAVSTLYAGSSILTEGFQQPYNEDISSSVVVHSIPDVLVYPNPVRDFISIEIDGMTGQLTVSVFDVSGRIVISQKIAAGKTVISCGSLANGIYMLELIDGAQVKYQTRITHTN